MNEFEDGERQTGDGFGSPEMDECHLLVEEDLEHQEYQFSLVAVWINPAGTLLAAYDSGCSCPTPFSGLTPGGCKVIREVADLEPLIESAMPWWWNDENEDDDWHRSERGLIEVGVANLKAKVHRALRDSSGRPLSPWLGYS